MDTLVWGLFVMIQNPERCTRPDEPCETLAPLGVTYAEKRDCSATAAQLTWLDEEKTVGTHGSEVRYVCVLQPKPGAQ